MSTSEPRQLSVGWMLSVLLVVLVAAYALLLFILTFFADLSSVDSLRFSAVFMLLAAVVTFGVLMFFGSGTMLEPLEDDEVLESPGVSPLPPARPSTSPAVCVSCGQDNPAGANFCYSCGTSFAPEPVKEEASDPTNIPLED